MTSAAMTKAEGRRTQLCRQFARIENGLEMVRCGQLCAGLHEIEQALRELQWIVTSQATHR